MGTTLHDFTLITHHEVFSTSFTTNFIDFQRFIGIRKSGQSNGKSQGFEKESTKKNGNIIGLCQVPRKKQKLSATRLPPEMRFERTHLQKQMRYFEAKV